ncbi:MAG: hypothetical protein QOI66_1764 [Myxococcales bacterium]|jgi:hypothetical protein|nr:hypothetical protein [Myxococcales bacterium]
MISKNAWVSSITVIAFLFASISARAADQPDTAQYRNLLADAVSEYDARRFDEARALFRRANDLSPNARTLRGIGMASFELRDYVEAYRALQASLADKRKPLTDSQRRQVEGLMEKTKAFTAHFAIHPLPLDATVRVDGDVPVIDGDGRITLGLGRHTISVDAVGRIAEVRDIHVFGGENRDLDFRLRLVEQPLPANPAPNEPLPPQPPPATDNESHRSHVGWWFAGSGALAVGAVIAGVAWHSRENELSVCKESTTCRNQSTLDSERSLTRGLTIGLAAGAIGIGVVGAILWSKKDKPDAQPTVACGPTGKFMYCRLLF